MFAFLLGLALSGVSEEDFALTAQGMARQQGCELQAVLEAGGGDVRVTYFTCPKERVGLLWARGVSGWEVIAKLTAPYPPTQGGTGI